MRLKLHWLVPNDQFTKTIERFTCVDTIEEGKLMAKRGYGWCGEITEWWITDPDDNTIWQETYPGPPKGWKGRTT